MIHWVGNQYLKSLQPLAAAGFALVVIVALMSGAASTAPTANKSFEGQSSELRLSSKLRKAVKPNRILLHERRLHNIADANGGNRASGTPGYDASADYVAGRLRAAGYKVARQPFEFPFFREAGPTSFLRTDVDPDTAYRGGIDSALIRYSGSGEVLDTPVVPTYDVQFPPAAEADSSNSGCEPEDFPGETAGKVALIQRGTCSLHRKVENAQAAGAVAAVIFNEGQQGRRGVLYGSLDGLGLLIPVFGTTFTVGEELSEPGARVSISVNTISEVRQTANVIANTKQGRAKPTVVVGAHLDSVPESPGINDNGSSVATVLEMALQMSKLEIKPKNRVRFAFWGAEEFDFRGSRHYVSNLSDDELTNIGLYLNFEMLGSPNYVRFLYDGDGSDTPTAGPVGSAEIEKVFEHYFASKRLPTEPYPFDGRSDYVPFMAVGVPSGGLTAGFEQKKTEEQAAIYGGTAGEPYDHCYHWTCDDITNISVEVLDEMSDGVAHATLTFAQAPTLFVQARRGPLSAVDP